MYTLGIDGGASTTQNGNYATERTHQRLKVAQNLSTVMFIEKIPEYVSFQFSEKSKDSSEAKQ